MGTRLRAYVGSTELNYATLQLTKSSDHIVNSGVVTVEANSNVTSSSTIDFKKADGSTTVFSAKVIEIRKKDMWELLVYTNGYELNNVVVQTVFTNRSPEYIVENLITNYTTNLTYASSGSSGVTLSKYIADGYALDIIRDMMDLLDWQMRIDESDNVYFEELGNVSNGVGFTQGTDINITSWDEDKTDMVNHVKVIGGFENHAFDEIVTGASATVYTISHKPVGAMKVSTVGVIIAATAYDVDAGNKQILFSSAYDDLLFDYTFNRPIIVDDQDDNSIATHGEIEKKYEAPWLTTFPDARRYASNILDVYSIPLIKAKAVIPELDFDIDAGEEITLTDNIRSKTEVLVISKIKYDGQSGTTTLECGSRDFIFYDWQREVQERIKKLERRQENTDEIAFSRIFKHSVTVSLVSSTVCKFSKPQDSFIFGHQTLGRFRTNLNFEADCSDNLNNGEWNGADIAGSQYHTSGFRLSAGIFNGTDNYINVADDASLNITGNLSLSFAAYVTALPGAQKYLMAKYDGSDGYGIAINASDKMEMFIANGGTNSTVTAADAITESKWEHWTFVKNGVDMFVFKNAVANNSATAGGATIGTNSNDFEVGRYDTSYYQGWLDEVMVYASALPSGNVTNIFNKIELIKDQKAWLSMDNPKFGYRESTKKDTSTYAHPSGWPTFWGTWGS